ncbi:MAG: DUF5658 family protein [Patescibacteria group bacterium]
MAIFIALQLADGILTYLGIIYSSLGINYEMNPFVTFLISKTGIAPGLFISKIISIITAGILYFYGYKKAYGIRLTACFYPLNIIMFCILIMHLLVLNTFLNG